MEPALVIGISMSEHVHSQTVLLLQASMHLKGETAIKALGENYFAPLQLNAELSS